MQTQLTWTVRPTQPPILTKKCAGCTNDRFSSSNKFRVNANGNKIDVWLIYKCDNCQHTWNLTVHSRISPASLPRDLYDAYAQNDEQLALQVACDPSFFVKNKARVLEAPFAVEGPLPSNDLESTIVLSPDLPVLASLGRVISAGLGISNSRLKKLTDTGLLRCDGDLKKTQLLKQASFTLSPGWQRSE